MTRNNYNPQDAVVAFDEFTNRLGTAVLSPYRRLCRVTKDPGAATVSAFGMAAPTLAEDGAGSIATGDLASGPWVALITEAVNGSAAWIISAFTECRPDWNFVQTFNVRTHNATTLMRNWVGLFSAQPKSAANLAASTIKGAAFLFDPPTHTTAFWRTVTGDGVAEEVKVTNVAFAANTSYRMAVVSRLGGTAIDFYINDVLVNTHSTAASLPAVTQLLGPAVTATVVDAVTGAARRILFGSWSLSTI